MATAARARAGLANAEEAPRPVAVPARSAPTTHPTHALAIAVSVTPGTAATTRARSQGRPTLHAIHAPSWA